MGIRIQPAGLSGLYAKAGKIIGEAKAAEKQITMFQRAAERTQQLAWQKERMKLEHQWNVEAFNRSKSWQIEKMEISSRADFARDEARMQTDFARTESKRQKELDESDRKRKAIIDSNILTDEERSKWLLQFETGLPVARTQAKSSNQMVAEMLAAMTGEAQPPAVSGMPPSYAPLMRTRDVPKARPKYAVGQIINRGTDVGGGLKRWKVIGFDADGEPLVEQMKK